MNDEDWNFLEKRSFRRRLIDFSQFLWRLMCCEMRMNWVRRYKHCAHSFICRWRFWCEWNIYFLMQTSEINDRRLNEKWCKSKFLRFQCSRTANESRCWTSYTTFKRTRCVMTSKSQTSRIFWFENRSKTKSWYFSFHFSRCTAKLRRVIVSS